MPPFFSDAYAFVLAHKSAIGGFLLLLLPTLITGLTPYPKAGGVVSALRLLLNVLSVLAHHDSPGTFKLPLTISAPPDDGNLLELKPKGFAPVTVLVTLAVACLVAAAAHAAGANPEALKQAVQGDANAVQPGADVAPPPAPQFGGCVRAGKICFGPSASMTLAAINLKTKTIEAAFSPGVGYGFTVNPGKWSSFGADAYFTLDPAAQKASAAVLFKALNGYLRVGASKGVLGDVAWRIPIAFGIPL